MPAMSHTETLGFAANVQKALEAESEALRAMGVDPERIIEIVRTARERASNLNATQEALKRESVATTTEYVAAIAEAYVVASGALDTLLAAVRKNSDAAKNLRKLRSGVHRRRSPEGEAPKEP